jgi:hypothetical protein
MWKTMSHMEPDVRSFRQIWHFLWTKKRRKIKKRQRPKHDQSTLSLFTFFFWLDTAGCKTYFDLLALHLYHDHVRNQKEKEQIGRLFFLAQGLFHNPICDRNNSIGFLSFLSFLGEFGLGTSADVQVKATNSFPRQSINNMDNNNPLRLSPAVNDDPGEMLLQCIHKVERRLAKAVEVSSEFTLSFASVGPR